MPILSEFPQLSTSLSLDLEPIDTMHPAELLPLKLVSEKADPTTNSVISIPDTATDIANSKIISDLFPDAAWSEENNRALRASWKRDFGEVPLEFLRLHGVPNPPQRRQLQQILHRGVDIPLDSLQQMQDPRRDRAQQPPAKFFDYANLR